MKRIVKIISFICVVSLFFNCFQLTTITSVAFSESEKNTLIKINNLLSTDDNEFTIDNVLNFYNADNSVAAKCYLLLPKGYAIFDESNMLVESEIGDGVVYNTLKNSASERIYYVGPFEYYTLDNDNYYINLLSDKKISKDVFTQANAYYSSISKSMTDEKKNSSHNGGKGVKLYYSLAHDLRNYSYNPNGICGATASAIALMYYRDYIDSSVVAPSHATSTGQELIRFLAPNMHGSLENPQPATPANVVSGCNSYFSWRGISNNYYAMWVSITNTATSFDYMKNIISSNRPIILLLKNHPTYGNHYITVYEMFTDVGIADGYYVIARNGWGGNTTLRLSYAVSYIYFNR